MVHCLHIVANARIIHRRDSTNQFEKRKKRKQELTFISGTNRFPGNFRSGSHDLHAEVSHPQHKGVMILQNGFNGHPQQPAVDQLAYRGPPGSMTNSGFSTRSATPTQSDDGSARQQQRSQHQPQSQAGVDTVRISTVPQSLLITPSS